MHKTESLSRRTMLRGAGVAMALPMMEAMLPRKAAAQAASALPGRAVQHDCAVEHASVGFLRLFQEVQESRQPRNVETIDPGQTVELLLVTAMMRVLVVIARAVPGAARLGHEQRQRRRSLTERPATDRRWRIEARSQTRPASEARSRQPAAFERAADSRADDGSGNRSLQRQHGNSDGADVMRLSVELSRDRSSIRFVSQQDAELFP